VKKLVVLMVCLGVLGFIGSAQAMSITYMVESIGSGTIGTQSFSDAPVEVSFTGDTANVSGGSGYFTNNVGTGTVSIGGIGTATFTESLFAFVNQIYPPAAIAGIADSNGSILDTLNPLFATYDLTSAIGPITGDTFFRNDLSYSTNLGTLNFSAMDSISTYTASTVPVPAPFWLFGSGLLGLAGLRRFRKS
jgi:hypothetical protein